MPVGCNALDMPELADSVDFLRNTFVAKGLSASDHDHVVVGHLYHTSNSIN